MLVAMEAAEAEGGDIRGRQSAALMVIDAMRPGRPGRTKRSICARRPCEPLVELRRLLKVRRAYHAWDGAEGCSQVRRWTTSRGGAGCFAPRRPDAGKPPGGFLVRLCAGKAGRVEAALPYFRAVYAVQPIWRVLVPRLAGGTSTGR